MRRCRYGERKQQGGAGLCRPCSGLCSTAQRQLYLIRAYASPALLPAPPPPTHRMCPWSWPPWATSSWWSGRRHTRWPPARSRCGSGGQGWERLACSANKKRGVCPHCVTQHCSAPHACVFTTPSLLPHSLTPAPCSPSVPTSRCPPPRRAPSSATWCMRARATQTAGGWARPGLRMAVRGSRGAWLLADRIFCLPAHCCTPPPPHPLTLPLQRGGAERHPHRHHGLHRARHLPRRAGKRTWLRWGTRDAGSGVMHLACVAA